MFYYATLTSDIKKICVIEIWLSFHFIHCICLTCKLFEREYTFAKKCCVGCTNKCPLSRDEIKNSSLIGFAIWILVLLCYHFLSAQTVTCFLSCRALPLHADIFQSYWQEEEHYTSSLPAFLNLTLSLMILKNTLYIPLKWLKTLRETLNALFHEKLYSVSYW